MTKIKNKLGNKTLATIGDDMVVHSGITNLGCVEKDGGVFNYAGNKVGYLQEYNGYIYKGSTHIGTVSKDGHVTDYQGHPVGYAEGDHVMLGGAALLLLVPEA